VPAAGNPAEAVLLFAARLREMVEGGVRCTNRRNRLSHRCEGSGYWREGRGISGKPGRRRVDEERWEEKKKMMEEENFRENTMKGQKGKRKGRRGENSSSGSGDGSSSRRKNMI
jgi:hypothetical protein